MRKYFLAFTSLIFCCFLATNLPAQLSKSAYLNPELSIDKRVSDLVAKMTLEEKVGQLRYDAQAIERLWVPEYNWWNECLHGVARNGRATVFPQAIGMAAAWDAKMMQRIGDLDLGAAKFVSAEFKVK